MKTKLITLLALTFFVNSYAQVGLVEHVISTEVLKPHEVSTGDFDNDGHEDVVSISWDFGNIAWYKNSDGQGSFDESAQIITEIMTFGYGVITADVDGDGNIDVLGSSSDDKVVWFKNLGEGDFGEVNNNHQFITAAANTDSPRGLHVADLNGDGYPDVISTSRWDDKIAWYENLGDGDFGDINTNQNIISTDALRPQAVYAADIDDDGDLDVISASAMDNKIAWYENTDGEGTFGPQQIITTNALGARSVAVGDLDGDNDLDVVSASQDDNKIAWYENIDGLGNFGTEQILTTDALGTRSVIITDFDNDLDLDILYNAQTIHTIAWFENIEGGFSEEHILTTEAWGTTSLFTADINGDTDLDVLSSNYNSNETTWYEQIILAVNENVLIDISVFPNPLKDVLNILSQNDNPIHNVQVYDILGRLVLEEKDDFNQVDVSNLDSGVLFVKIQTTEGVVAKKIIKE